MRQAVVVCVLVLAMSLGLPPAAYAQEPVTSSTVRTVSGAQIASQVVSGLSDVEVGSSGTTLTVDIEGTTTQIPVDYSRMYGGEGEGENDLRTWALLGLGIGTVLRFLGLLLRLGG